MEFWFEFASTYSYPAAMRVEEAARAAVAAVAWRPFLLGPIFKAQDRDIADPGVLRAILEGLGKPAGLLRDAESEEAKAALRPQTGRAQALGIFGAPSFMVGEELFWGGDRLDAAVAWAGTSK